MQKDQQHISVKDELQELSPELAKLKKKEHFKVPDGYFEEFPYEVQKRVLESEKNVLWELVLKLFTVRKLAIAGLVVAGLVFGVPFLLNNDQNLEADVTAEELLELVEDGTLEFDEDALIDVYAVALDDDVATSDDDLNDEDIINYLIDEDIDIDEELFDL